MPVAICFHRFGPYHISRLTAAAKQMNIVGIEFSSHTSEYSWDVVESNELFKRITIVPDGDIRQLSKKTQKKLIWSTLDFVAPSVVAVNGWATYDALMVLAWAVKNHVPRIMMSDSTAWDYRRYVYKEHIKKAIISLTQSALVGGTAHADYMKKLGLPPEKIFKGYDTVDNSYFFQMAQKVRTERHSLSPSQFPYFLTSCRFLKKKNLFRLFDAFALYRKKLNNKKWQMIVLGDGSLRPQLEEHMKNLQLEEILHLPGFKQYNELPSYYAQAGVYIQPSTTEQWGLTVNEAMASGLPVLVSQKCGCAPDLVHDGYNGYTFDPYDTEQLSDLMLKVSSDSCNRKKMGQASQKIINHWSSESFAAALAKSAETALTTPLPENNWYAKFLLQLLTLR